MQISSSPLNNTCAYYRPNSQRQRVRASKGDQVFFGQRKSLVPSIPDEAKGLNPTVPAVPFVIFRRKNLFFNRLNVENMSDIQLKVTPNKLLTRSASRLSDIARNQTKNSIASHIQGDSTLCIFTNTNGYILAIVPIHMTKNGDKKVARAQAYGYYWEKEFSKDAYDKAAEVIGCRLYQQLVVSNYKPQPLGKVTNKNTGVEYDCEIQQLNIGSKRQVQGLQDLVRPKKADPNFRQFEPLTDAELKTILGGRAGIAFGVFLKDGNGKQGDLIAVQMAAFPTPYSYNARKHNLAHERLPPMELWKTAHFEATVVKPDYQRNGLQQRMRPTMIHALLDMGIEHVFSSVAPDNYPSLISLFNTKIADDIEGNGVGMVLIDANEEQYSINTPRDIFYQNLRSPILLDRVKTAKMEIDKDRANAINDVSHLLSCDERIFAYKLVREKIAGEDRYYLLFAPIVPGASIPLLPLPQRRRIGNATSVRSFRSWENVVGAIEDINHRIELSRP